MSDIMEFANREEFRRWLYQSRKPTRGRILTQRQMPDGKSELLGWWIGSIEI